MITRSDIYSLKINGTDIDVYMCSVASYALASGKGPFDIEITVSTPFNTVKVRPLRAGISPDIEDNTIRFTLSDPAKLSIELDGNIEMPLFLLINPEPAEVPVKGQPGVRYFESGQIYDAGDIELSDGETLYIAPGAIVTGNIISRGTRGIRITGGGILDGSVWRTDKSTPRKQMIKLIDCKDIIIEGITVVDGPNWHIVPIHSENVAIRNVNIITINGTGDGIDIVGSKHVRIENCFIRSNDDCIALKATAYQDPLGCNDVEDVRVARSIFWNAAWGNALEIGYETRCAQIKDVVFEDSDVIRCEFEGYQSGGTFTIHNGDRAVISDIRYENIRVEDSREKLIDIKILHSQYSKDPERGQIRNILFKDIQLIDGPFPVSIIRGFDGEHLIDNITFENLTVYGREIQSANDAKMVVELSKNVKFR